MSLGTIILVPGIGGCELSTQPILFGLGPSQLLWLRPAALLAAGWRLMGLSPDGVTPDVPLTGPLVAGPPLASYYGTLGLQLERLGWRVVGYRYDWRRAVAATGDPLADLVVELARDGPVHMIGHSRGGLIMRRALDRLRLGGLLGLVGRCVGLGVPHQGSFAAAGLLASWVNGALWLAQMASQLPALVTGFDGLGQIHDVVATWPAAYELLPRPSAAGLTPGEWLPLYDAAKWTLAGWPVSSAWLSYTQLYWAGLPDVPEQVSWLDVVGYGLMTPTHLRSLLPPRQALDCLWEPAGDNTVPEAWGTQPGKIVLRTPTGHGSLVSDGRVIHWVDRFLRGEMEESVTVGGPVLP